MNEARIYKLVGPDGTTLYVKAKTQTQARAALTQGYTVTSARSADVADHLTGGGKIADMTAKRADTSDEAPED